MAATFSRKTLLGIAVVVIVIIAAVVSYYWWTTQAPPEVKPIKIALIPPLTGPAARTGKELQDGVLFAYDDLKAAGKIPIEIDGVMRDIEFMWLDSKSDPEEAVKAYEDAIVRGEADILGWNWHSSVAMALYKISTRYNKIHWADMGETQYLCYAREENPEESKYWFKCWACPPHYGSLFPPALVDAMEDIGYTPRNKIAAMLAEDTDYGIAMAEAVIDSLEKQGWTVAYYDRFTLSPPETEFSPVIAKYKEADVSLAYLVSTSMPSTVAFIKQTAEAELQALRGVFGIGWFSVDEWYPALGETSDYVLAMDACYMTTNEQREWADRFKEKYGYEPSVVVAGFWGYDLFTALVEALNKAKTLNPDVLRSTLLDMVYHGLFMTVDISAESIPGVAHYMEIKAGREGFFFPLVQYKNGEYKIIWPEDIATGDLEIPPGL